MDFELKHSVCCFNGTDKPTIDIFFYFIFNNSFGFTVSYYFDCATIFSFVDVFVYIFDRFNTGTNLDIDVAIVFQQ